MRVLQPNRKKLVDAAAGRISCDLSIVNVNLVNVITGEIYQAEVDIVDGIICRVREKGAACVPPAKDVFDGQGKYLIPGFVDTHMHIESTMMAPENFGRVAAMWGTTTAVTDPHEIGYVMGIDGVSYMVQNAKKSPMRLYSLVPTCVPSVVGVEGAGAEFYAEEVSKMLKMDGILGLAEIMDYMGVVNNDERMSSIIAAGEAAGGFLQGHCPGLSGDKLNAYLCGGPVSEHECRTGENAREKLRLGMYIDIKNSSLSDPKTLPDLLSGLDGMKFLDRVCICTDDVHVADLISKGHMNYVVSKCIECGMDPVQAVRSATINCANEYGFKDIGAVAPGYVADLQLVDNLEFKNHPAYVFKEGQIIAKNGELVNSEAVAATTPGVNTVNIPQIAQPSDFYLKAEGDSAQVLVFETQRDRMMNPTPVYETMKVENGHVVLPEDEDRCFVAVINRYGSGDMCIGVCRDFHLEKGCVGSTISHDCHNMVLIYKDIEDAYAAAMGLKNCGGGMVIANDGKVQHLLPLEIGGLMSPLPHEQLAPLVADMDEAVGKACGGNAGTMLAIAVLSLPVRPGLVITDRGVVRGDDKAVFDIIKQ